MSFAPVIPMTGYAGWTFLSRTLERQQESFVESGTVKRATEYFRENIGKATTAEALVGDRRLLEVALGAFGLEDDINAKAFIRKVLSDGTIKDGALANRLADKRYAQFSFAFGYGNGVPTVATSSFADKIIARYEDRQFEAAVGEVDGTLRQALNFSDALGDVVAGASSNNARWYSVMGNTSLRNMFEVALGLPTSFGTLDVDQQLATFKERSDSVFGTDQVADFANEESREKLIRLFLVRSEIAANASGYSAGQVALSLLQSS